MYSFKTGEYLFPDGSQVPVEADQYDPSQFCLIVKLAKEGAGLRYKSKDCTKSYKGFCLLQTDTTAEIPSNGEKLVYGKDLKSGAATNQYVYNPSSTKLAMVTGGSNTNSSEVFRLSDQDGDRYCGRAAPLPLE